MNKRATYLSFFALVIGVLCHGQIQEPFSIRFSESLEGDFTIIANNMISRTATGNYNGNSDNHDFNNNVYVDIDNDNSTFNSSSAVFTNPDLSVNCINIFKAYIYWAAADTEQPNGSDNQPNWNFNDIKLMLPGETNYTTYTADDVIFRGRNTHFDNDPYICVKDITNQVLALPDKYGTYQVANVEAAQGVLSHSQVGTAGGWQIVFVYESPELPSKNITLFDGYAHVTNQVNDFDINFNGFQTTPVGNVNANVVMGVLEGDRNLIGDRLQILNVANNFVDITAPLRPANNFFNSRITVGPGDYTNRTPASTNTLGFDAAVFELDNPGNSIITNNQTSATLRLTSTLEVYGLYLLGLAVEIYQPSLNPMVITQTSGTNPADPGDVIGFNFTVGNTGNDNALNVNLATTIPPQAMLLPITNLPNGVTYTYDPVTGDVVFTIADGLLDVGDPELSLDMELQINDECYFLEDNCDLSFDLQFTATYVGEVSPDVVISVSTSDPNSCTALPYTVNVNQPIVNWLTAPGALDVTVSCEDSAGLAAAQNLEPEPDKCTFTLNKTSGPFVEGNCPSAGTYTNTWNFTDACGVTISNYVQTITITDTEPPTASDPAPVQVQCVDDVPTPNTAVVTDEADNCSAPTVAFVSDVSNNQTCPEIITRTYSVTDACGNSINVSQVITVNDDILPTASDPSPLQVQCVADVPAPDPLVVTDEDDNCSIPTVAFVSDVSDNQSCPETITRTYSVTDACNNSITVTQLIVVNDDILPTASDPSPILVQCITDVPSPDPLVVTDEDDNCSIPTVAFVSDVSDNQTCPETITRTYSITDDCDNSITVTQLIIVNDDILPTASDPAPIMVQCTADVPAPDPLVVTDEDDNCSIPTVVFVSDVSDNQTCPETITRTYSVTDACDNSITVTQLIIVNDDILPTASDPAPILVQCIGDVPLPDPTVVIDEADNCSVPVVAFVSDVSDNQSCPETITRTFSVTDECNNSITVAQLIIVNDDILPTASDPMPIQVQCIEDVPTPDPAVVIDATDNCSVPVVAFEMDVSNNQSCPETITRTYTVTDACNNSITVTQLILVNDDILPTASDPAPLQVQCIEDIPAPDPGVVTDESDNCSVPTVEFVSDVSDNQTCPETITRTYRVTDACDNSITVSQLITVMDDIPPTASDPAPVAVQCISDVPAPNPIVVIDEMDNCSTPTVAFVSDVSDNQTCSETITRTYSVTDDCGNFILVTQQIIISDETPPVLITELEPAISVSCEDIPVIPILEFDDNCTVNVTVEYSEETIPMDDDDYDIIRNWVATDDCNNASTVTQTIQVRPEVDEDFVTVNICVLDDPLNLDDLITNTTSLYGEWESDFLDLLDEGLFDPANAEVGVYEFEYTFMDYNCKWTTLIEIVVNDDCANYPCIRSREDVTLSKLVTANNDGFNDFFKVEYTLNELSNDDCDISVDIEFFNRWGAKVFKKNNYENDWSGTSSSGMPGGSGLLPTGTYYYVVTLNNSGLKPIQGYILLTTN